MKTLALPPQQGGGGVPLGGGKEGQLQLVLPPGRGVGIDRPLLGEEDEQGLLDAVAFVVALKEELHCRA